MNAKLDLRRIPPEVAVRLRFYVYAYIDPRDSQIFYVGKGCRRRALAHLDDTQECEKTKRIAELKQAGLAPELDIIAHGMQDERTALRVEAALIDVLRLGGKLTNRVRGIRALQFGRTPLSELEALYAAKPVTITEPSLLIRINRLYQPRMSPLELYEATRGVWKLGERRNDALYAFAVYEGVIRQVFGIQAWFEAGTTPYSTRTDVDKPERWEFTGAIAGKLARKYRNGSVRHYLRANSQNPTVYLNC